MGSDQNSKITQMHMNMQIRSIHVHVGALTYCEIGSKLKKLQFDILHNMVWGRNDKVENITIVCKLGGVNIGGKHVFCVQ